MLQHNKYSVEQLNVGQANILNDKDKSLISTYDIGYLAFYPEKYTVDLSFYTLNGDFVETHKNIGSYSILNATKAIQNGTMQITVDPVQDCTSRGYKGDVILEYNTFNNLFSNNRSEDDKATLYVTSISANRKEIRARSVNISDVKLKEYSDTVYDKLNNQEHFEEIYLNFADQDYIATGVNIKTEVVDGTFYVAFKLYEALPRSIDLKSIFTVVERIGEPVQFKVIREVVFEESPKPALKGPNFSIDVDEYVSDQTDYKNYTELLSYPSSSQYYELYSRFGENCAQISIDYNDYKQFIHFSSATERLENFKYKLSLIEGIQSSSKSASEKESLKNGIISNFDHYEKFLYFESGSVAWPKTNSSRPYVNDSVANVEASTWWSNMKSEAEVYDLNNVDILTNTIPVTLREDPNNEPYLIFVHMIGQHFDNEWIYAKAVTDRYKADNRLDFGISKDLVKDALTSFGLSLQETNQNLTSLFEACKLDGTYVTGSESSVSDFRRLTTGTTGSLAPGNTPEQPILMDTYRQEMYKRIYHNIPLLTKTKGTNRGLRALVACFGIPDDILEIRVDGSVEFGASGSYFGPESSTTSSVARVNVDQDPGLAPITFVPGTGFVSCSTVSEGSSTSQLESPIPVSNPHVSVGFNVNGEFNSKAKKYLDASTSGSFNYDNLIGDPRNKEENYGEALSSIVNSIPSAVKESLRSPSAIIRLVRYIDSSLMRALQDFIPARDGVASGVIVQDNLLHRSRPKPVEASAEGYKNREANIRTGFVTGSSGGAFEMQNTIAPTTYSKKWSTGTATGSKTIDGNVPVYNGELGGAEIKASDAEAIKRNKFRGQLVNGNPFFRETAANKPYWNTNEADPFKPVLNNATQSVSCLNSTVLEHINGSVNLESTHKEAQVPDSYYSAMSVRSGRSIGAKNGVLTDYKDDKAQYTSESLQRLNQFVKPNSIYNDMGIIKTGLDMDRVFFTVKDFYGSVFTKDATIDAIKKVGNSNIQHLKFAAGEFMKYSSSVGSTSMPIYISTLEGETLPAENSIVYNADVNSRIVSSKIYVPDRDTVIVTDEFGHVDFDSTRITYEVIPTSFDTFSYERTNSSVVAKTNDSISGYVWKIESDVDWITLNQTEFPDLESTIGFTVESNSAVSDRSGSITVTWGSVFAQPISIYQRGMVTYYSVTPEKATLSRAVTASVALACNTDDIGGAWSLDTTGIQGKPVTAALDTDTIMVTSTDTSENLGSSVDLGSIKVSYIKDTVSKFEKIVPVSREGIVYNRYIERVSDGKKFDYISVGGAYNIYVTTDVDISSKITMDRTAAQSDPPVINTLGAFVKETNTRWRMTIDVSGTGYATITLKAKKVGSATEVWTGNVDIAIPA